MFGFSLPKLLLLMVLLAVVWYFFKFLERRSDGKRRDEIEKAAAAAVRRNVRKRGRNERVESVDTAECETCGSFIPRNSPAPCERSDCPHPDPAS